MAAGVPVICSDIDGPRELVEDGRTGLLFPVADDEALFERLRRAHESPEVMASLARAASAAVLRFDVARMADEYAALYAGLAGRP
jgi:glycosyltransferase involved in cell wall biosynthesis